MPGSTNFQQHNPTKANQENDAAYTSDPIRSNGAVAGIYPSASFNKLAYQLSTFVAAFAQSLSGKGYTISDSDIAALKTALDSVVTMVDTIPNATNAVNATNATNLGGHAASYFASLADPHFTGIPTVPTAALGTNTTQAASTAFVQAQSVGSHSLAINGYQVLPSGMIMQWGTTTDYSGEGDKTISLPISFPNAILNAQATTLTYGINASIDQFAQVHDLTLGSIGVYMQAGVATTWPQRACWFAIGY